MVRQGACIAPQPVQHLVAGGGTRAEGIEQRGGCGERRIHHRNRARVWSSTHVDEYAEGWSKANQSAPDIAKVWFKRDAIKVLPISLTIISEAQATADFLVDAQMLKQRYDVTPLFDRAL